MDRGENPYASPRVPTTPAESAPEDAERIANGRRRLVWLYLAMTPLAFVTLVLMLVSAFENEQYPYGGTLMGQSQGVRGFIRLLFVVWFAVAAVTIIGVARVTENDR